MTWPIVGAPGVRVNRFLVGQHASCLVERRLEVRCGTNP